MSIIRDIIQSFTDAKTWLSLFSLVIASFSLYSTRKFWIATNRPIISAQIINNKVEEGDNTTPFSLVLYNSGNRPAVSIQLKAERQDIDKIINSDAKKEFIDIVYDVFSEKSLIPLLLNGKEVSNYFGQISRDPQYNSLKFKSQLPIEIEYLDLENRKFITKQILQIKISESITGQKLPER